MCQATPPSSPVRQLGAKKKFARRCQLQLTISSIAVGMLAVPPGAKRAGLLGRRDDFRAGDSVVFFAVCFFAGDDALAFLLVAAIIAVLRAEMQSPALLPALAEVV